MTRLSTTKNAALSSAAGRARRTRTRVRWAHAVTDPIVSITSVARVVSNLERSVTFYKALGFRLHPTAALTWRRDRAVNRAYGIQHSEAMTRIAKLSIDAAGQGAKFILYLREYKGIPQRDRSGHTAWDPGVSHFGLVASDADALWSKLRAKGMLRARSWGEALIAPPGETQGVVAYITDPDGLDIEIIRCRPAVAATPGRPARPGFLPGVHHVGLVVLHAPKERRFYERVLSATPRATRAPWLKGDFYDAAVGGHGNILRLYNESFPFASTHSPRTPSCRMNFELIEFKNRKKPVRQARISDIGVGCVLMQTDNLEALLLRAEQAGAKVISGGIVPMPDGTRVATIRDPGVGGFIGLYEQRKHMTGSAVHRSTC